MRTSSLFAFGIAITALCLPATMAAPAFSPALQPGITNQTFLQQSVATRQAETRQVEAMAQTLLTNQAPVSETPIVVTQSAATQAASPLANRSALLSSQTPALRQQATLLNALNVSAGPLASIASTTPLLNVNCAVTGIVKTGFAAIGQTTNDFWNLYAFPGADVGILTDLLWSDLSASTVSVTIEGAPGLWALSGSGVNMPDPMYDFYIYPWSSDTTTITVSNLTAGSYDFYIYTHEGTWAELFLDGLSAGSKGTAIGGTNWASTNWEPGQQFVVFRNVTVANEQPVVFVLWPDIYGLAVLCGMQIAPSGAVPVPDTGLECLVNVNFGTLTPLEVGPAAVGQSSNDFWNLYYQRWVSSGSLTNLLTADGSITEVGLTVDNAPGVWALTWSELVMPDPMYDVFIYPFDAGHAYATITNLPDGAYDFYVYSHDGCSFELYSGGVSQGYKGVAEWGSACMTADWDEGQQYVVFRNVTVTNGQSVVIDVTPGYTSYAMLSGLQIAIPLDRDQNGLPDWWEQNYFGHTGIDPNADPDDDGLTNLQECQLGTDPTKWDTDGDGLSDSEELAIPIDVDNPSLGYLDPLNPDTGNTGVLDGDKDSDHDGLSNWGELRNWMSSPDNAHTFSANVNDATYLMTFDPLHPADSAVNATESYFFFQGYLWVEFTFFDLAPDDLYDVYFTPVLNNSAWQWRRVASTVPGQTHIEFPVPDPDTGFFLILSAKDYDGDGLTDGYEAWFRYAGNKHTSSDIPDSDSDLMWDGWEVEYGLNPTSDAGVNGANGNPDGDSFSNFEEYQYYSVTDGSFDPLKVYNTAANRPIVSVAPSTANPSCEQASFTISRYAGLAADYSSPLTVFYAVGGSLSYDAGDYTISPTPAGRPRIYAVTIPGGEQQVTLTMNAPGVSAMEGEIETIVVTITPYEVAPVPQVPAPTDWLYVVDWPNNRATATFDFANQRPVAAPQDGLQTCRNTALPITLTGSDGCSTPLSFTIVSGPSHGTLSAPITIDGTSAATTYTPSSTYCGQDAFSFKVNDGLRDSVPAVVTINVGDPNPTAVCQDVMTGKNIPITLLLSGADACNETLTFTIVPGSGPAYGTLSAITPVDATHAQVTYTPNSNFEGTDTFYFTANDCSAASEATPVVIYVVSPPSLTSECRDNQIILRWAPPPWIEQTYPGYINDYVIYRCETTSGPCMPVTLFHIVGDPNANAYVDMQVTPGTTYCYKVAFRHQSGCVSSVTFESPYSDESCATTCSLPPPIRPGCDQQILAPNDDNHTGTGQQGSLIPDLLEPIGFSINYFGNSYSDLYVNNNGNVTFQERLDVYTPQALSSLTMDIIAPFWADVDTRAPNSATVSCGICTVSNRPAFMANWIGVGYFLQNDDKLNVFQLVLIDRSDISAGDFDMEFNYARIQWETGDANGGSDGLGGDPARAGYSSLGNSAYELPGSGSVGAFLDSNLTTGLVHSTLNNTVPGRYLFQFRNGHP